MTARALTALPVTGLPEVRAGDDLAALVVDAAQTCGVGLRDGDVLAVTSKVVSKAAGLTAPAAQDREELVLRESTGVVSERGTSTGVTRVVSAQAGPVLAGAGIDASNTGDAALLLLPHDPDEQAARLRADLRAAAPGSPRLGVLLTDTAGRPWRAGLTDFALGASGLLLIDDLRGHQDADGREMAVTLRCLGDELASAADLVKGKVAGVPVAVLRGLDELVTDGPGTPARELVRSGPDDWFALGRAEAVRDALGVPAGSALSRACGIESVHPEPLIERVRRAVRVTLVDGDDDTAVDIGPDGDDVLVELSAPPVALGRAWGRLEVALAGERLDASADAPVAGDGWARLRLRVPAPRQN